MKKCPWRESKTRKAIAEFFLSFLSIYGIFYPHYLASDSRDKLNQPKKKNIEIKYTYI